MSKNENSKTLEKERRSGKEFRFTRFLEDEGLLVHKAEIGFSDVTELKRTPWARSGGNVAYLELKGTFQSERGVYVCDIPPGKELKPLRHIYEEEIFVLAGTGVVQVWQGEGKRLSVEVQRGSVLAFPPNADHAVFNSSGDEPLIYMGVNTAPRVINALYDPSIVFASDHRFIDIYADEDYFAVPDEKTVFGWYKQGILATRFIPDAHSLVLDDLEQKVQGGQLTGYAMGPTFPRGHVSAWPSGIYHKGHYHGPGAVLLGLDGEGYVLAWPSELGARPYANGFEDQVVKVEWGANSIYVPPDGYFHQHFNTGDSLARHIAVYGEVLPLGVHDLQDESGWRGHLSFREGGTLIEYEDEDPRIREDFTAMLDARGIECMMSPVQYRD